MESASPGPTAKVCSFATARSRSRDITDGLSQTIAVGERSHLLGVATWSGAVTGALLYDDDGDQIGSTDLETSPGDGPGTLR